MTSHPTAGSPSWDPGEYARFADERARPFDDLLAHVRATTPSVVVDLGCGSGALTARLAERWPGAAVAGVDSSPQMVQSAGGRGVDVHLGDLRDWRPAGPVDVVVANAVLQWVPGHPDLLRRWVSHLTVGGELALQVPGNFDAPSHALMRDLATRPPYVALLDGVLRGPESVGDLAAYAELLIGAGCTVDAWETTYLHVLDPGGARGDDAVLAWVSGTGLRPVLDALAADEPLRMRFVAEYAAELRRAYPRRAWGTPLAFRRVFCVARRESG